MQGKPVTVSSIAEVLGVTAHRVRQRARSEGWKPADLRRVRGAEERLYAISDLPADIQSKLMESAQSTALVAVGTAPDAAAELRAAVARWQNLSAQDRVIAEQRAAALDRLTALLADGAECVAATDQVAAEVGVSRPTLYRWRSAVRGVSRVCWPALLADARPDRRGEGAAEIPAEAWRMFLSDYLRPARRPASCIYKDIEGMAAERGWKLPTLKTFLRKMQREIEPAVIVKMRDGIEAVEQLFPAQVRQIDHLYALAQVNADGHKLDVFARTRDERVVRPILVVIQDIYSRAILAWRMVETEGRDAVQLAFLDLFARWGVPRKATLDNGRAFASKAVSGQSAHRFRFRVRSQDPAGLLPGLGCEVSFATPYHGQAKPIERSFRTFACDGIAKAPECAGAYTGNSPMAKPADYGSRAVAWDVLLAVTAREIDRYNRAEGRRGGVAKGRSYWQVFEASYAAGEIRPAPSELLTPWLLASEPRVIDHLGGVTLTTGWRYWSEQLLAHRGERVVVRFDGDRLDQPVLVTDLEGRLIAQADPQSRGRFDSKADAETHSRVKRAWVRKVKDAAKALDLLDPRALPGTIQQDDTPIAIPVIAPIPRIERQPEPETPEDDPAFQAYVDSLMAPIRARYGQ